MNRWPDYRDTFLLDEADQVIVSEVRGSAEQAWIISFGKGRVGICEDGGEKETTVYMDQNRLVVGNEFREQRHEKQCKKEPQRPIPAAIGLEVFPATSVDWRYFYPAAFRNRIRHARFI